MFFPWIGFLEQIRLADIYVHYSDVQFSKGSFTNRVQIKTSTGIRWLTVPLSDLRLGQTIEDIKISTCRDWRAQHLALLKQAYSAAPYMKEMMAMVKNVYEANYEHLDDLAQASMSVLCDYFGLSDGRDFVRSNDLDVVGHGSQRVLDIVKAIGGTSYVTGWGARHYLDHAMFDEAGVQVEYMDYRKISYPQLHGAFTPFVSALDLVANCGRAGVEAICSNSVYWKKFINE